MITASLKAAGRIACCGLLAGVATPTFAKTILLECSVSGKRDTIPHIDPNGGPVRDSRTDKLEA